MVTTDNFYLSVSHCLSRVFSLKTFLYFQVRSKFFITILAWFWFHFANIGITGRHLVTNPLHNCAQVHRLHVALCLTLSQPPWRLFCSWLVCCNSFIFRCRPSAILSSPVTFIRWEKVCPLPHRLILFSQWQSGCGGSPSSGYPAVTHVTETNQVWTL